VIAEAGAAAPVAVLDEPLAERYARMAHLYERRPVDRLLRVLDVLLAGLALVALSPLLLLVSLTVLASGGQPILYAGPRVGRAGRTFTIRKFRTLKPGAEQRIGAFSGAELTQLTQSEVTRVGAILRATKLDELPQLFNVLVGDMSMVGPRPIRPLFFAELSRDIPQYWQRLVVRPGLTGFAQLRLTRDMTWAEKLAHDFEYIADRGVRLYAQIVVETAWFVLRPNRAIWRDAA
jgi:lipopolysaccharide/colanic/teichoic acid biosynthesis glycosyltransferase